MEEDVVKIWLSQVYVPLDRSVVVFFFIWWSRAAEPPCEPELFKQHDCQI